MIILAKIIVVLAIVAMLILGAAIVHGWWVKNNLL